MKTVISCLNLFSAGLFIIIALVHDNPWYMCIVLLNMLSSVALLERPHGPLP